MKLTQLIESAFCVLQSNRGDSTQTECSGKVSDEETHFSEWAENAAENSSWSDGILGQFDDSMYWLIQARKTAPDYESPILSRKMKANIAHDYVSSLKHAVSESYEVNDDVTIRIESDMCEEEIHISIDVDDFERWASDSRLYNDSNPEHLGFAGKFYVDLVTEISDALGVRMLVFECDEPHQRYSESCSVSPRRILSKMETCMK